MAAAPAEPPGPPPQGKEVTGFVRVERDHLQGYRSLKSIKSFWPGEVLLRELPMVDCGDDSDFARLAAYCRLEPAVRHKLLEAFPEIELKSRVLEPFDEDELDDLVEQLKEMEGLDIGVQEAQQVLQRFRFAAHVSRTRIFERGSTLWHSCAATVDVACAGDPAMASITARYTVNPQTRIGAWLLPDASLWWKGADVRAAALREGGLLMQDCACERCHGDDLVRALRCPDCLDYQKRMRAAARLMTHFSSALLMATFVGWCRVLCGFKPQERGLIVRNGKLKRWRCTSCDFNASDSSSVLYVNLETQLVKELEDIPSIPKAKLAEWVAIVESRIGLEHWLAPALWVDMYRREVARGSCTFPAALAGLKVFEWFVAKNLPRPPPAVIEHLSEMIFSTLTFLQDGLTGLRDLRVIYLRAIDVVRVLIEQLDKSLLERFKVFAGTAQNIRRRCGFCNKFLVEKTPEEMLLQDEEAEDVEISAQDDGNEIVTCVVCNVLSYCSTSCQIADKKRHQHFCLPPDADFRSKLARKVFS